ncbi:hypothetical protein [Deferrisoma palaeochoriense]
MADYAELVDERTLRLPPELAKRFRPSDRFAVWIDGDTVCLKRVTPLPLTEIVEKAEPGEPLPAEAIAEEVRRYRRENRRR